MKTLEKIVISLTAAVIVVMIFDGTPASPSTLYAAGLIVAANLIVINAEYWKK